MTADAKFLFKYLADPCCSTQTCEQAPVTTQRKTAKASKPTRQHVNMPTLHISTNNFYSRKKLFLLLLIILKLSVKGEVIYKASCNVSILDT